MCECKMKQFPCVNVCVVVFLTWWEWKSDCTPTYLDTANSSSWDIIVSRVLRTGPGCSNKAPHIWTLQLCSSQSAGNWQIKCNSSVTYWLIKALASLLLRSVFKPNIRDCFLCGRLFTSFNTFVFVIVVVKLPMEFSRSGYQTLDNNLMEWL